MNNTLKNLLENNQIHNMNDLIMYVESGDRAIKVDDIYAMAEYLNPDKENKAAYYTDLSICKKIFEKLPHTNKKRIRVLEPSVGVGVFLSHIANHFKDAEKVEIYIVDIDNQMLYLAKLIFSTYFAKQYSNVKIVPINDDYLMHDFKPHFFDYIIGNPPFKVVKNDKEKIKTYRLNSGLNKTKNLYSFFIEKAIRDSRFVSLIAPKMFLIAPEHDEIRNFVSTYEIPSIIDFGQLGFKGVLIETINLMIDVFGSPDLTSVDSMVFSTEIIQKQNYIIDSQFPTWILYRSPSFDRFVRKLNIGIFKCFRDRQITSKNCLSHGKYRVLRSRNILTNAIVDIPSYDLYLNDISNLEVRKFLNKNGIVCIPNLTYFPRACFLPNDCVADGSVALLTCDIELTTEQLEIFESKEFGQYYEIVTNYSRRSLNIDRNSVYYFGVLNRK